MLENRILNREASTTTVATVATTTSSSTMSTSTGTFPTLTHPTISLNPPISTQSSYARDDLSSDIIPRVKSIGLNTSASAINISGLINRSSHQRQSSIVTSPSTSNIGMTFLIVLKKVKI